LRLTGGGGNLSSTSALQGFTGVGRKEVKKKRGREGRLTCHCENDILKNQQSCHPELVSTRSLAHQRNHSQYLASAECAGSLYNRKRKAFPIVILPFRLSIKTAFTLAEMMVVMLILSIVMAAFAPVMTTRSKTAKDSPWRYAANQTDAYYGTGAAQTAMIGQPKAGTTDNAKLVINVTDTLNEKSHILLKRNNDILGRIFIKENNLIFGNNLKNLTGDFNTIIGKGSLLNNISGSKNTAIGFGTLTSNQNTDENTAIGYNAMNYANGTRNVGIGPEALNYANGAYNTGIGYQALNNTSGSNNIALGSYSMASSTGSYNVALGTSTLRKTTGSRNIALGEYALNSNTSGGNNIALGTQSMLVNETGEYNISLGYYALMDNKTGSNNIALGNLALNHNTASNNVAIGNTALSSNTSGSNNIALGTYALNRNTSGGYNVGLGYEALNNNLNGSNNVAMGQTTLTKNTSGSWNVALGMNALANNTTGTDNVAIGWYALSDNSTGKDNIAIGESSCRYVTGSNKTCIGYSSGPSSSDPWRADDVERVFIGGRSKFNGGAAVLEVHNSGDSINGFATKDATVVINGNLLVKGGVITTLWRSGGGGTDNINLYGRSSGQMEPFWPEGAQWLVGRYGNDSTRGTFRSFYSNNTISDARLKYIGKESTSGLDKIKELKVFNYTFKKDEKKTPRVGVIAQDLQKIFPDAVTKGEDGYLQIRMEDMFYALVNSVKEIAAKIDIFDKRIKALENENKLLKEQNKEIMERLSKLEKAKN